MVQDPWRRNVTSPFPPSGNEGYIRNRDVPYQSVTLNVTSEDRRIGIPTKRPRILPLPVSRGGLLCRYFLAQVRAPIGRSVWMEGKGAPMIFAAVFTVRWRVLRSAALQFPYQTVMQLVSTLSMFLPNRHKNTVFRTRSSRCDRTRRHLGQIPVCIDLYPVVYEPLPTKC